MGNPITVAGIDMTNDTSYRISHVDASPYEDSEVFQMRTSTAKEYRIQVARMGDRNTTAPVVYLLPTATGSSFGMAVETVRLLQQSGRAPQDLVVVAIGDPQGTNQSTWVRRSFFELTPDHDEKADKLWGANSEEPFESGGGAEFQRVLTEEIKPLIEREYNGKLNNATLVGHSLGGLLALHVMENSSAFER